MLTPITQVFRPYEVHAQWYAYEQSQSNETARSAKPKPSGSPAMPWPQYRFEQFAKKTSADLANVINAADRAKQSAETAKQTAAAAAPADLVEAAEAAVEGYNQLSAALSNAGSLLKPATRKWMSRLPFDELERIGIARQSDGTLRIDSDRLAEQAKQQPKAFAETLRGSGGFADQLAAAVDHLRSLSASSLIDQQQADYRSLSSYTVSAGGSLQTYLSVPLTGVLLDIFT